MPIFVYQRQNVVLDFQNYLSTWTTKLQVDTFTQSGYSLNECLQKAKLLVTTLFPQALPTFLFFEYEEQEE